MAKSNRIQNTFRIPACLSKVCFLLLLILPCIHCSLVAQTNWTGAVDVNWFNSANWSNGIPDALDDVVIPNVTNDPVIFANPPIAYTNSIKVESGAVLTIQNNGMLSISPIALNGLWNQGTVQNHGQIMISNAGSAGPSGIKNEGTYNNHIGSLTNITWTGYNGIDMVSGTISNEGEFTISALQYGVMMASEGGTFSNNTEGTLTGVGTLPADNFINAGGTLSPGNAVGPMNFNDDETFTNSNIYIEVFGSGSSGNEYDVVNVAGAATLGGTLSVYISYSPVIGDEITILNAASISGTFSDVYFLPGDWYVVYSATKVKLVYGLPSTTWTGNINTDWNHAGNWSPGLPVASTYVTIPNVTNDPVISTLNNNVRSVTIQTGGMLTLNASGKLTLNGSDTQGLLNQGTVINNGNITVGNLSTTGINGIVNSGIFTSNASGQINIDRTQEDGTSLVDDVGSTFTNTGTINIGTTINTAYTGLDNLGTFTNNAGGVLNINRCVSYGINTATGTLTNSGTINLGTLAGGDQIASGIAFNGPFNNNSGGQINIDRCQNGIYCSGNTFANAGTTTIGISGNVNNLIQTGGSGMFNNNTGGIFKGTGTIIANRFANNGGTIAPGYSPGTLLFDAAENFASSIMQIEVNGISMPGVNYDKITVNGGATLGGTLALTVTHPGIAGDQVTILSAQLIAGTFTSITGLPANWFVNYTSTSVFLSYGTVAVNTWTGNVNTSWNTAGNWTDGIPDAMDDVVIPDVTNDPIISSAGAIAKSIKVLSGGVLTVNAAATIAINGASTQGFWNQGTVHNNGILNIGNTSSVGNYGLYNEGTFNNNTGSQTNIDRVSSSGILLLSNSFANAGTITIGGLVTVTNLISGATGMISNNTEGIVKGTGNISAPNFTNNGGTLAPGYSPGIMTFTASESFSNNILSIEVNGTGTGGTNFDKVIVSGTATLGGTLNVTINYTPAYGDEIVFLSASAISGTFTTLTGLPANWYVIYLSNLVKLQYGLAATTWTGNISTDWNTPGNWSPGLPVGNTVVTIPNVTNDPIINTGSINVKLIAILPGGLLTITNAGILTLNSDELYGIYNQGTVQNNGIIYVGNNISTSIVIGIANDGTFNNNAGGQIYIDRTATGGISVINGTGSNFTNAGTITIGATENSADTGLYIGSTFTNTSTGIIHINRCILYGVNISNSTLHNSGIINIGVLEGSVQVENGINLNGQFNNNTGGQIHINRCVNGILSTSGTFANAGSVTIGELGTVTKLIESAGAGIFNNNTGGTFKGTGIIVASRFANVGGTLAPGYSPGTLTFNAAENFANNIFAIEVNGSGTAGVNYDNVIVQGTATIGGGTLNVSINYTPTIGDIFTIVNCTNRSGTFTTVTGLPANWYVTYQQTTVKLVYGLTASTWTGNISTAWNVAGNWSQGLPVITTAVIIPDVTNDPVITTVANIKSMNIQAGGSLTISVSGTLSLNGAEVICLNNEGTVQNNGIINMGNTSTFGQYGIANFAIFDNNAGGQINIDRTIPGGTSLAVISGTFTNLGTINIGATINTATFGVDVYGTFINSSGSVLNIDRCTDYALRSLNATFTNNGNINIGALAGGGQMLNGISLVGMFNNNPGGQIQINRCDTGIFSDDGTFQNAGALTIGASGNVPTLLGLSATAMFNNNTSGIFKATGTIASDHFTNNGGTLAPGYSPGLMSFDAEENFANSILSMEVNGTGSPGNNFDQVTVNGYATLGGTLAVAINYIPTSTDAVTLLSAPFISGTFSSVTGLPAFWVLSYTPTSVELNYDSRNTWTGNINTNWNTAGNWTAGIPLSTQDLIIPNVTNDPIITTTDAMAKYIRIQVGGVLRIDPLGALHISGVANYNSITAALYNQGMLDNRGSLIMD